MTYKVLIVDDSKLARMAVVKALRSCYPDAERLEAGSAEDAMTFMETERRTSHSSISTCRSATAFFSPRIPQVASTDADRNHLREPSAGGHQSHQRSAGDIPTETGH